MLKPIITYGCEIWGPTQLKLYTLNDMSVSLESFIKHCKYILGVNKSTNNTAVRGELGAYPLAIYVILQSIKYWLNIARSNDNSSLAHKCLQEIGCDMES